MTVNTVNNKIYVGIHITETPYKFDGYYGDGISGTSSYWFKHPKYPFQRACKKYGLKAFKRYTLFVFDTYGEAMNMERQVVNEEFIKRPDTYNIALGGGCGLIPSVEIEVHQYDLEGKYLKTYRSKSDACRKNNFTMPNLQNAILCKGVCNNSYWSETKVSKLDVSDYNKVQNKFVYVYDANGNYIQRFDSMSACARNYEVNLSSIQKAITNQTKCKGYYLTLEYKESYKPRKNRQSSNEYYQYSLDGKFIQALTLQQVKEVCGVNYSKFHKAMEQHYNCAGYLWSRNKFESIKPLQKERKKKIYQYDLEGNLIKIWDSYRECDKAFPALRQVLKGVRSQTKGFVFKYKLEN